MASDATSVVVCSYTKICGPSDTEVGTIRAFVKVHIHSIYCAAIAAIVAHSEHLARELTFRIDLLGLHEISVPRPACRPTSVTVRAPVTPQIDAHHVIACRQTAARTNNSVRGVVVVRTAVRVLAVPDVDRAVLAIDADTPITYLAVAVDAQVVGVRKLHRGFNCILSENHAASGDYGVCVTTVCGAFRSHSVR